MTTATDAKQDARTADQRAPPDERLEVETVQRRRSVSPATWVVPVGFGVVWAIDR